MTNAIETQRLSYHAGRTFAIEDLALHVPAGAIYGFLGPNGCGKTTTIRLVLGLLRPRAGHIQVLGSEMPGAAARVLTHVGYVPEQPHLDPTLTVRETVAYQAAFYPAWDGQRAEQLVREFRLDDGKLFGRLSKGQKGKLMVLLALAQQPELLVLDEPTDGLDPVVRRDILSALLDYVSERRATIFISSHLIHELERFCNWIGVMDDGRLVLEVPMDRFKHGMKRLHVHGAPARVPEPPFVVLGRHPVNGGEGGEGSAERWAVRDWEPAMAAYFATIGADLRDVIDLDLEEGFVELLRAFRDPPR
ncbi:MAG: ABC transporter ATP-binding protein [Gemmatimonadales bacterium]